MHLCICAVATSSGINKNALVFSLNNCVSYGKKKKTQVSVQEPISVA